MKQSGVCQKNTEKQITATTGEQRVSCKTQSKAYIKGRPPGCTTVRRTGCAPWGGGASRSAACPHRTSWGSGGPCRGAGMC